MVVLIKKKRNSVKDKRYIKIQGKYTKRFLHSKKKPGQQIYMQRGGSITLQDILVKFPNFPKFIFRTSTAKECATRMAILTVITLMFGPFCMTGVRHVISVLWSHIGLGTAMYVQYVATVDYFQGMFAIGMDFSQYIPEMARVFGGAMGSAVFTTVKYIAETLWIYKSYLTQYRAISAILDVCTTATITPIMDFMLKQIEDIFTTINKIQTAVGETAGTFAFIYAKIIEIKNHIVLKVIKPLFDTMGTQLSMVGGDLIKGLDRWGGKIGMSIERFTLFYLKIGESNTVEYMYDTVAYMKDKRNKVIDWSSYLLNLPFDLIYRILMAMDEKAIYSKEEEARNTEIYREEKLYADAAELHQALLAKDADEAALEARRARKHLKAVQILEALDIARMARAEADQAATSAATTRARESATARAREADQYAIQLAEPLKPLLEQIIATDILTTPTEKKIPLLIDIESSVNKEAYSTAATGMLAASLVNPADEIGRHITNLQSLQSLDDVLCIDRLNDTLQEDLRKQELTPTEQTGIVNIEGADTAETLKSAVENIKQDDILNPITKENKRKETIVVYEKTNLPDEIKAPLNDLIDDITNPNADVISRQLRLQPISRMTKNDFVKKYKQIYNLLSVDEAIKLLNTGFKHTNTILRCTMSEPPPVRKSPSPIRMNIETYASVAASTPRASTPRARAMSLQPIPKIDSRFTQLSRNKNSVKKLDTAVTAALGLTPVPKGGTRKRMRYGKRKTQRRQRQRRRHH